MSKKVNLVVFKGVEGLAFMDCEFCDSQILLTTDKLSFCRNVRQMSHPSKSVYKLKKDLSPEGFSKVMYHKVSMVNNRTIKELEKEKRL